VGPGAGDPPPSAPTGLDAAPGSGEGEIDIDWNDNSEPDLDHYRLERADNPSFSGASSFTMTSSEYADSGLTPGDRYYYRVYAVDAGSNESDPSSSDSALATDLDPAAPTGLDAAPGSGDGEIDIDWNDNGESDLDHYRLERSESPSFAGASSFTMTSSEYSDSGLTPGERYYYRAYAVDDGGNESDPSSSDSALATDLAPSAPTGLTLTPGVGEGEIYVSWSVNPEPDIDRYRLERSIAPDFEPGSEPFEGAVTHYQDSGLTPGELYYYRVYAIDAGENVSAPSAVASDHALDLPPATPTGLTLVPGPGEGEIEVSWDANSEPDLDHYLLERDTDDGFGPGSDPFEQAATYFPDSGLVPGDEYFYRVTAIDAGGNESDPSGVESALALDLVPAAPTGLVAVAGAGEGEIDVDWDDNAEGDIDHYRLERADNPSFTGADSFTSATSDYADSGLTPGDTYHYRAYAVDAGGNESPASGDDYAVATDLAPAAPTGLVASPGAGQGEIDVDWNDSSESDFDHYRLERADNPSFTGASSFTMGTSEYADSGLTPGETYHYRAYAVDAGGNESPASGDDYAVATDLAPVAPTGLLATPGAGQGEIDVDWNDNGDPDFDHYRLERADNPSFTGADSFTSATSDYADSGLTPGETYYYRAYAVDDGGNESPASNADSAVATDVAPAAPTGLMAEDGPGEGEILLSWNASMELDFDHYRLERDTTDVFGAGTYSFETTDESYLDGSLDAGTYYYRLFAVDAGDNESAPSDTVDHTLEQTDVPENLVASVSFVRPNPFRDEASIAYAVPAEGARVTMRVYDITGRLVTTLVDGFASGGVHEAVWNGRDAEGQNVASGIYFCRAEVGDVTEVMKVVLMR